MNVTKFGKFKVCNNDHLYSTLVVKATVPLLHGDTESVVAGELVVAASGEQERLAVARVASAQVATDMLR